MWLVKSNKREVGGEEKSEGKKKSSTLLMFYVVYKMSLVHGAG